MKTPKSRQTVLTAFTLLIAFQSGWALAQSDEYPPQDMSNPLESPVQSLPPAGGYNYNSPPPSGDESTTAPSEYYANYSEQAMTAFHKGDYTNAITLLTKALQMSPTNTALLNNLAASYIQRGVFYQNTHKDYEKALADYRMGTFYLVHEWPSGVPYKGGSEENVRILKANLESVWSALKVAPDNWKWHLQSAWDLRRKGLLQQAMVEYAMTTDINPKASEAWTAQGDIYSVRQKWEKAVDAYQKAVNTASAKSDSLYVHLGTAELQASQPEKAVDAFNQAMALNPQNKDATLALEQIWRKELSMNPRNISAHINLGAVYQQMDRPRDAYNEYETAERLSPGNPLVKLNLASLAISQKDWPHADAWADSVLAQDPSNVKALLYKADILKQTGRGPQAEQYLSRALETAPDKKAIMDQLVGIYKAQGDNQKLHDTWQRYAEMFPQDADVQYQAGLSLHEIKDYEGAVHYYQEAIHLKPDFADAYANLGTALHALNRDDEALAALQKALKINPNMEEVKTLVASLNQAHASQALTEAVRLHQAGQYQEAIAQYEIALKRDPKNPDILSRYGLALQSLKHYKEAQAAYDKAIAASPDTAIYYYYKGTLLDEQNQVSDASHMYEKALALDPTITQAKDALANLQTASTDKRLNDVLAAYNKKEYPQALQMVDQVIDSDAQNATAYYYKGLIYDAEKKTAPAQEAYQKTLELDPKNTDAAYALAVAYDTEGKKEEAKTQYQQFLDLMKNQPEDDFVKYAKQRVSAL